MKEHWCTILSVSSQAVTLDIRGQRYEYSAAENDIRKFQFMLRHNQGTALAFLKEKAFVCIGPDGVSTVREDLKAKIIHP